jgi:hypothetical protein
MNTQDDKVLEGYLRLACDVLEIPAEEILEAFRLSSPGRIYQVRTPNKHFTGELLGVWFQDGRAEVSESLAETFQERGLEVVEICELS